MDELGTTRGETDAGRPRLKAWEDVTRLKLIIISVIVGIDPGTTVGIAVLDLDGRVVKMKSYRNKPLDELVNELSPFSPAVVASDVSPMPSTVKKIAHAFNASVFSPPKLLSVSEKNKLAKGYNPANNHERDALSAALKAFQHYAPKIRRAKRIAREKQEEIVRASLEKVRIADIVKSATSVEKPEEKREVLKLRKELGLETKRVKQLEKQLSESRTKLSKARKRIIQVEARLKRFDKRLEEEKEQKRKARDEEKMDRDMSADEVESLFRNYKKKL